MKKKSRSFFPQISCKKAAKVLKSWGRHFSLLLNHGLKLAFLFSLFLFLFFNLHSLLFPENERLSQAKREVLNSPFDSQAHANLAKIYLEIGDLKAAKRELSLAKLLTLPDPSSLENLEQALEETKEKPQKIRQEISFWEKIAKEKPNYRDAYFQLAVLNYQISQNKEAKNYLQKTLDLSPNFEPAKKIEKLLSD